MSILGEIMARRIGAILLSSCLLAGCVNDKPTTAGIIGTLVLLTPVMVVDSMVPRRSEPMIYSGPIPEAVPYAGDDIPLYRGVTKTPAMTKSDADFVAAMVKLAQTRKNAAYSVQHDGWMAFNAHDFRKAALRFNQAWLLDPDAGERYHSLALIAWQRDHDSALAGELFQTAAAKGLVESRFMTDHATFLLATGRPKEALPLLNRVSSSFNLFQSRAYALLVLALDDTGDHAAACRAAAEIHPIESSVLLPPDLLKEARRRTVDCPKTPVQ